MTNDPPARTGTVGAEIIAKYWPQYSADSYVQNANAQFAHATTLLEGGVPTATKAATDVASEGSGVTANAANYKFTDTGTALTEQAAYLTNQAGNLAINAANHKTTKEILNGIADDHDRTKDAITAKGIATGTPQSQVQQEYDTLKTAADTAASKVGDANKTSHNTLTQAANNGTKASVPDGMSGGGSGLSGLTSQLQGLTQLATTGPQLVSGTAGTLVSSISGMAGPLVEQLAQFSQGGEGKPGEGGPEDGKPGDDKPGGKPGDDKPAGPGSHDKGGDKPGDDKPGSPLSQSVSHDKGGAGRDSLDTSAKAGDDKPGAPGSGGGGGAGAGRHAAGDSDTRPTYSEASHQGGSEDKSEEDKPGAPTGKPGDGHPAPPPGQDPQGGPPPAQQASSTSSESSTSTHLSSGESVPQGAPASPATAVGTPESPATAPSGATGVQTHTSSDTAVMSPNTSLAGAPGAPAGGLGAGMAPVGFMGGPMGGGLGAPLGGPAPAAPSAAPETRNVPPSVKAESDRVSVTSTGASAVPEVHVAQGFDAAADQALSAFDEATALGIRMLGTMVRQNPEIGAAAVAVYPTAAGQAAITCTSDALGAYPGGAYAPQGTIPLASIQTLPENFRLDWAGAGDPAVVLNVAVASNLIPRPAVIVAVDTSTDLAATTSTPELVQQVSVATLSRVEPMPVADQSPEIGVRVEHVTGVLDQMAREWQVPEDLDLFTARDEMYLRRWTGERHPEYVWAMVWWMVVEGRLAYAGGDVAHAASLAWQILALPAPTQ